MLTLSQESSKSRVLSFIHNRNAGTAQDIAGLLSISTTAARRHLTDLEKAGFLISHVEKPDGRGRPQQVFRLSEKGEESFPRRYKEFCNDMLEHLEKLHGAGAMLPILDARRAALATQYRARISATNMQEQLEQLCAILDEAGFQATATRDENGTWFLDESNCPYLEIARKHNALCQSELELYSEVLGINMVRESRIVNGAAVCRYRLGTRTN